MDIAEDRRIRHQWWLWQREPGDELRDPDRHRWADGRQGRCQRTHCVVWRRHQSRHQRAYAARSKRGCPLRSDEVHLSLACDCDGRRVRKARHPDRDASHHPRDRTDRRLAQDAAYAARLVKEKEAIQQFKRLKSAFTMAGARHNRNRARRGRRCRGGVGEMYVTSDLTKSTHRHSALSHQRRTRCPTIAPTAAMMAQAAAYQIATNAVPSFLHASA